jgi:hypothetical protein
MINRTKYLVQFEMRNKFCYIVDTLNIPYDSLNSNEKIIQIMLDNTPKNYLLNDFKRELFINNLY